MVEVEPDAVPHTSYSALSDWVTCGKKYQLGRIQRAPKASGWAAVGGTAVHAATAFIDMDKLGRNLFQRHFEEAIAEEVERNQNDPSTWRASGRASKQWPNKEDRSWWEANGPEMVASWVRWRKANPDLRIAGNVGVELEIEVPFADDLPPTKMYLDRLFERPNGSLLVVDIKTGTFKPADALQLGVYASGVELTRGVRPAEGAYWMARKGDAGSTIPLDAYSVEYIAKLQRRYLNGVKHDIFLPRPSTLCDSCSVKDSCYAVGGKIAHFYDPDHPLFDEPRTQEAS